MSLGERVSIHAQAAFEWAAKECGSLFRRGRLPLKIRSGEHLAAIALAGYRYELPASADNDGGVDLEFANPPTLIEVKSLPERWRSWEARSSAGDVFVNEVVSFGAVAPDLEQASELAARQLRAKVRNRTDAALEAVVVASMWGHIAAELFNPSDVPWPPELPAPSQRPRLDRLWVVWHPDLVQYWDNAEGCWTSVLASGADGRVESLNLEELEWRFLEAAGVAPTASPFAGRLR